MPQISDLRERRGVFQKWNANQSRRIATRRVQEAFRSSRSLRVLRGFCCSAPKGLSIARIWFSTLLLVVLDQILIAEGLL